MRAVIVLCTFYCTPLVETTIQTISLRNVLTPLGLRTQCGFAVCPTSYGISSTERASLRECHTKKHFGNMGSCTQSLYSLGPGSPVSCQAGTHPAKSPDSSHSHNWCIPPRLVLVILPALPSGRMENSSVLTLALAVG